MFAGNIRAHACASAFLIAEMADVGDDGISALVAQFVECTDASVDVAKEFLEKTSGNLEVRV